MFTDFDSKTTRTEHTVNPPIELIEPQPPLTVIRDSSKTVSREHVNEQEANAFVDTLAKPQDQSITISEHNDQFVRHDSVIALPDLEHRMTSIDELLADPNLTADTPLTLHYTTTVEQLTTLAELSDKYEDQTVVLTIIDQNGQTYSKPLFEFLSQKDVDLTAPITLITQQKHSLQTTLAELVNIKDIDHKDPVVVTINHGIQELSVKEIIQSGDMPDNALFYLHRVTEDDLQGLWGIIQSGLIDKFRQGVHIDGISPNKDTVRAVIPADADEKLTSGLSSFLGKILTQKVNSSYIYNFSTHTMNHDPNLVYPGQQLIMIHFSPEELKQIYQFFSDNRNQGVESFAVGD
ncbi:MAG: hypothetical protein DRQ35_03725 [Gammaproteobacteria bacterium]|nr:MAG: hypothetical protein DRQ35_03725 [Gammaproteobacteria bacterium]